MTSLLQELGGDRKEQTRETTWELVTEGIASGLDDLLLKICAQHSPLEALSIDAAAYRYLYMDTSAERARKEETWTGTCDD